MTKGLRVLIILTLAVMALTSCAEREGEEPEIASVGGIPILLKDFEREVSMTSRRDPTLKINASSLEDLLDSMMDRKLLIREAMERGLSEDEQFIDTIKAYWEQTLIRELVDARMKELADEVFVTEEEARAHYRRMGRRITVRTADAADAEEAERVKGEMVSGSQALPGEPLGPLYADDVPPAGPLYEAFDMEAGEAKIFKSRGGFTVVMVTAREPVETPAYEEVEGRLKAYLLERKKQKAFEDWLAGLRSSSDITVDRELLEGVADE